MDGTALFAIFLAGLLGIFLYVVLGAMILLAAISLYNKLAGGRRRATTVPIPTFGNAVQVVFVQLLVGVVVGFVMGFVMGMIAPAIGIKPAQLQLVVMLLSIPMDFALMTLLVYWMLETTFPEGILIAFFHKVIYIVVLVVIAGVFFALFRVFDILFG